MSILFAFFLWGCTVQATHSDQPITKIVYAFQDASVPPEYHRSYTITVEPHQAHLVVNSYGDLISEAREPIDASVFNQVVQALKKVKEHDPSQEDQSPPCVGGTGSTLTVYSHNQVLVNGVWGSCERPDQVSLSGDVDSLVNALKSCFRHFEQLLQRAA